MATVSQKICDRCGKPLEYIGWTAKLRNVFKSGRTLRIIKYHNGNSSGYDYIESDYELCVDCTKQLGDFLNMKGEVKNENTIIKQDS